MRVSPRVPAEMLTIIYGPPEVSAMFSDASARVRESLYGVWGRTTIGDKVYHTPSSGFMIAPGVVMTHAHSVHLDGDVTKPVNKELHIIRSPDIGKQAEATTLITEDIERDLLRQALEATLGNQTKAAEMLGLTRDALRYRMKKFGFI